MAKASNKLYVILLIYVVLAEATGKKDLAEEIESRLQLYQAGRPYREK